MAGGYPAGSAPAPLVEDLQKKREELRKELLKIEAQIVEEEALLRQNALHHRPSYSLLKGESEDAAPSTMVRQVSPQDFDAVLRDFPSLVIEPIGSFNHWDRRECAVANPEEWKAVCSKYQKEVLKGKAQIPKVIHQIWIGPKEPPCLWIDTFRVEYLASHPGWGFHLWSDDEVARLPMINEEIYNKERMWQCKADILRLEFLWHHGGMYVDADMISVEQKSLDKILDLGNETGWVIAYEPDTKDKPYSILGNSVIACTPHHPLTLMLILYLKQTFHHKRDHIDVFAVTGPVMYTKCLVDSKMPISLAPQEWLYPAFHYVPNPDAINFAAFPKCLMFQFGYTCSGLEGYVKSKNRCKKVVAFTAAGDQRLELSALSFAYECKVPCFAAKGLEAMRAAVSETGMTSKAVFLTDREFFQMDRLRQEMPGFLDQLGVQGWDAVLLGVEWSTGSEETVIFPVVPGGRPRNCKIAGLVANLAAPTGPALRAALQRAISEDGFDPSPLFEAAGQMKLHFLAEKYAGPMEEARLFRSMPVVHRAFQYLAGHEPPMHFDNHELHGNLMKGYCNGAAGVVSA
ncbi:unnamed protein product, partial [Effrenium voratum]